MRYLEDPALKLAVVLLASSLILTGLIVDAGVMERLILVSLGAIQTIVLLLRR